MTNEERSEQVLYWTDKMTKALKGRDENLRLQRTATPGEMKELMHTRPSFDKDFDLAIAHLEALRPEESESE